MASLRICFLLGAAACLSSCVQSGDQSQAVQQLSEQVKGLAAKVDRLGVEGDYTAQRVNTLEAASKLQDYTTTVLDPAKRVYMRLDSSVNVGTFAIVLRDVRPFADGVKVRLDLGNLTSVTFIGATLTLKYGRREPDPFVPENANAHSTWSTTLRNKEERLFDRLLPGHWNPVQVVLPGIEPKDLGYLQVSIATDQVGLY